MFTTWRIDPAHTEAAFAVRHLMISTVRGRFSDVKGDVVLDGEDFGTARFDVTIPTATVDTREPQRDQHLRSADFFDVEKFPVMTFSSREVARAGDAYRVMGDLTIRGITRPVTFDVSHEGRVRDPWGGERAGFSATTVINRKDFGLVWNAVLEAGGVVVGDEVRISVDLELVKQASASAAA
ncbi:MAG TPA: YceI family protein [Vicinamibacterales bacterium]|nr:YceI family protein [Vicinamibacterales bacterium]